MLNSKEILGLDRELFFMIVGFLTMVGIVMPIGLWLIGEQSRQNIEKLVEERNVEWAKQKTIWESLDCSGKKDYLKDKDLKSSTLFFPNLNEQFYREYVLECTP